MSNKCLGSEVQGKGLPVLWVMQTAGRAPGVGEGLCGLQLSQRLLFGLHFNNSACDLDIYSLQDN